MSSSAVPVLPAAGRPAAWAAVAVPLWTTLCRIEVVVSAASRLMAWELLSLGRSKASLPSLVIESISVNEPCLQWLARVA